MSTVRFVLRLASLTALGAAVWLAVLDATASIAAEHWVLTPLRGSWAALWPEGLAGFDAWGGRALPGTLRDGIIHPVLGFPGWAVMAALALLLGVVGYEDEKEGRRPARPAG